MHNHVFLLQDVEHQTPSIFKAPTVLNIFIVFKKHFLKFVSEFTICRESKKIDEIRCIINN